jgi:acetyl-CoA carboxylase biotin carboxyl carrier protein
MKLMTPVKSEVAGKIVKILVEDEQVVDFDKPLYIVEEG